MLCSMILFSMLATPFVVKAYEQQEKPTQIMLLGTYHFANPGLDVAKFEVADVLSPKKQEEILEIVDALVLFEPTKIAIEAAPSRAAEFKRRYQAYLQDQHELTRNERQQLGFRLAALCEHPRLYPIDHSGNFPMGPVMAYAHEHDPAFVEFFEGSIAAVELETNSWQQTLSIGEILRRENAKQRIEASQSIYLRMARVGDRENPVGADLLSAWYDRNIRIFANIAAISEPGDRVLVIIGAGHLYIIGDLIRSCDEFVLVDPLDYL